MELGKGSNGMPHRCSLKHIPRMLEEPLALVRFHIPMEPVLCCCCDAAFDSQLAVNVWHMPWSDGVELKEPDSLIIRPHDRELQPV